MCVCVCVLYPNWSYIEFKCTYFVSELVEFRILCRGGEIVLCPCTCIPSLSNAFCCTVKDSSARVDDVYSRECVSHVYTQYQATLRIHKCCI